MLIRPHAVIFVLGGVVVNRAAEAGILIIGGSAGDCDNFVDCVDGFVVGKTDTTCHDECAGHCCTDPLDCNGFTGKVCADGSCSTKDGMVDPTCNQNDQDCIYAGACANATIPFVTNSCVGPFSCKLAGNNGSVGNMTNSCRGYVACDYMAYDDEDFAGATVGHVTDSCNGFRACLGMAREGGHVGSVTNSCNADNDEVYYSACEAVGWYGGTVGDLTGSCNGGDEICLARLILGTLAP